MKKRLFESIPAKANKLLNLTLLAFLIIILRIWHLTIIQHESREENALKPQRRTLTQSAKRGTIRDRFNIPLAVNRVQYNAAILYSSLRQIPSVKWENKKGVKKKLYPRKTYISRLANLFAEKLSLESSYVEDLIHAKGALYNQIPFIIKEDITEKEYYSLKALEKDWPGVHTQKVPKRFYPQGKVGCDIVGYLGAINRIEYESIISEMSELQAAINALEQDEEMPLPEGYQTIDQMEEKLKELKAKSYTLTDRVGKAGVEARYERELRGLSGKKSYRSDARGNLLDELPGGQEPTSGKRIILSISSELQAFAEELLIKNEQIRETRATPLDNTKKRFLASKKPWIKGGAALVLDPHTGEILALASHPRFDPNDYILSGNAETNSLKKFNINRWLENEFYISDIWDQKYPLERERYDVKKGAFYSQSKTLTWRYYLQRILAKGSSLVSIMHEMTIAAAFEMLESKSASKNLSLSTLTASEQSLCLDLCQVLIDEKRFDENLLSKVGKQTLGSYHRLLGAFNQINATIKEMSGQLFHEYHFTNWRKNHERAFLSEKRKEEKMQKRFAKPYIDLLNAEKAKQFEAFWNAYKWSFFETFLCGKPPVSSPSDLLPYYEYFKSWHDEIKQGAHQQLPWQAAYKELQNYLNVLPASLHVSYLKTFRCYAELNRPLYGKYPQLRNSRTTQKEKDLAAAFYPRYGLGYGRSQAYRQSAPQGSIFKLVVAYEALKQQYQKLKNQISLTFLELNPLEITDTFFTIGKETYIGYTSAGKPIPRFYKGGRIPRSTGKNLGKMDLLHAIETSSNPYFSLLAGDVLNSPHDLVEVSKQFSYGERTGIDLPGEIPGKIPADLETNRTGLYATAIGQHSLVVTPLQAGVMLAALANGGKVLKPKIVKAILSPVEKKQAKSSNSYLIHQPDSLIKRMVDLPKEIRQILLEGMHRVVQRSINDSLFPLSRLYKQFPEAIVDYVKLKNELIGKTSTAEVIERIDLDLKNGVNIYNHVWFGGISFTPTDQETTYLAKDPFGIPELVVVVYLRFGGFGKESAPLAAQLVSKWREIKKRNQAKALPSKNHLKRQKPL